MISVEAVIEEIKRKPELAKKLAEALIEASPRLSIIFQYENILMNIESLRGDFNRILKRMEAIENEQRKLREDFNRIIKVVENLQISHKRLEERLNSLAESMIYGFGQLSKFAGLTFEEFVRMFLSEYLREQGLIPKNENLKKKVLDEEEINLFFEDPLIVGEVTSYAGDKSKILKLLRKAELARERYNKEPKKFLIILTAAKEASKEIRKLAEENDVKLIIGKTS